ncbi:MAG TPA: TIM barrel protein [Planctomycetota bacterium]|nr:TIM barrel protein [Planctomycetota bacterium]
MSKPIALQLYSLRELAAKDFAGVLKTVSKIGYAGVEFAGLHGMSATDVKKVIDSEGLVACSAHTPMFEKEKWNQIEDDARTLGYTRLVGMLFRPDFESADKIKICADKVNEVIAHFEPKGFSVHYHNHDWEFDAPGKDASFYGLCPKANLEIDIYWVQVAGQNPAEVVRRYANRTELLHIKDGPCDRKLAMTAVGKGKVDVAAAIHAAEAGKLAWNIVELDRCDTDMVEAVRESHAFLTSRGLATGK